MNWVTIHHISQADHAERLANAERGRHFQYNGERGGLLARIESVIVDFINRDSGPAVQNDMHRETRPVVHTDIRKTDTLTVHTV